MSTSIIKIGPHQPYEIVARNGAPEIDQSAETTVLILTEDCPFYPLDNDPSKDCSVRTLPDGFPPDPDRPFRKRFCRAIEDFMLDHPIAGPLLWLAVCLLIVLLTTLTLAALAAAGYIESPWR